MHSRRLSTRILVTAVTLAVAAGAGLTGCTASGSAAALSPKDSPLVKMLGSAFGADNSEALREQERTVQKLVAQCMTDEGFEYTPNDRGVAVIGVDEMAKQQTEEWISKNGYGMSVSPTEDSPADPNDDYVASLSESQQQAYYAALHGEQPPTEDGTIREYDEKTAGCYDKSYRKANGGKGFAWQDKKYAPLLEKMNAIEEKTEKVPAVKAAAAKWSECMADAGYSGLKKQQDAVEYASEKNSALYGGSEESGGTPPTPSAAELKKARDAEIKIALADFRCAKKTDYTDIKLRAQFDLEKKFIADNKAALDELVATYQDKK
ncbi:hypothetical protein [Leifsonia sp. LS-T14]|uniref:hypothetical protein n=1 Tax=unclassified Leifsonia TaxID=2663824 RepID=UPI0035A5B1F4